MSLFKHTYYFVLELNYGRDETAVKTLKDDMSALDEPFKKFFTDPDLVFKDEWFKRSVPIKIKSKHKPTPNEIDNIVENMFTKFNNFRGGYTIISYLVRECSQYEYRTLTTMSSYGDPMITNPLELNMI